MTTSSTTPVLTANLALIATPADTPVVARPSSTFSAVVSDPLLFDDVPERGRGPANSPGPVS